MSLTGQAFPVVLAFLAALAFVAIVLGKPRLKNRIARACSRGILALAMNLLVVLLAGALLNDQYAFYVSWDDLMGVTGPPAQVDGGGSANQVVSNKVRGSGFHGMATPAVLPPLPNPGARMQSYQVTGATSQASGRVLVYLPKGYNPKEHKTYPVVEAFHGYPSRVGVFQHLQHFFDRFDDAVAKHQMAPSIIVMPDINPPSNADTECVNIPNGYQTETWISHDIPLWTVQHFRVQTKRTSWATFGFSFGGWCAGMVTMRHPDIFGAAIVMQGYFRPDFDPGYVPLKPNSPQMHSYDLVYMAHHNPPPVGLWILASKQDSLSYPSSQEVISGAKRPLYVMGELLASGGHREAIWEPRILKSLVWLARTLPGFAPGRHMVKP